MKTRMITRRFIKTITDEKGNAKKVTEILNCKINRAIPFDHKNFQSCK